MTARAHTANLVKLTRNLVQKSASITTTTPSSADATTQDMAVFKSMQLSALWLLLVCLCISITSTYAARSKTQERGLDDNRHGQLPAQSTSVLNLMNDAQRNELVVLSESLKNILSEDDPFCSGRISSLLQRCTTDALDADSRDEAAVFLTLCDRSRDYIVPMECEGLVTTRENVDKMAVKRCSTALDQHQNFQRSYDVYRLLIIPEKCKSLNTIFNVDPLKDVYRNMTLDLMTYLRAFASNELRSADLLAIWEYHLDDLKNMTSSLGSAKESLEKFNDHFVASLKDTITSFDKSLNALGERTREENSALSSDLRDRLSSLREEHETSLTTTLTLLTTTLSTTFDKLYTGAIERQQSLDVSASLVANQISDVMNDLITTRQEFEMLSSFMRESGARAYDQALLLDAKQTDVSNSLSDLSVEIAFLAQTTRELNASMSDITARNTEYLGSAWAGARGLFPFVLGRLNFSAYLVIGIVTLALPRLVLELIFKTCLWLAQKPFLLMTFLFRRGNRRRNCDTEKNDLSILNFSSSDPDNKNPRTPRNYDTTHSFQKDQISPCSCKAIAQPMLVSHKSEAMTRINYYSRRSHNRVSRLPERLYHRPDLCSDKLPQLL